MVLDVRAEHAAKGRSAPARGSAPHAPCNVEIYRDAGLGVASEDGDPGRDFAMPDTRDLLGRAQAPFARRGYRQEGIMAQPESAMAVRLEAAYRHDGALDLDFCYAEQSGAGSTVRAVDGPAGNERLRAELVGRLVQFIDFVVESGLLEGAKALDAFAGRHALQKYAYIAQELGMRIGYRFEFLKNGAYSPAMAVDIYERSAAVAGSEAFVPTPRVSKAFVEMVGGRGLEWLQIATFAVRDHGVSGAHEKFANDRYGHLEYDKRLVRSVFAEVSSRMGRLMGGQG